MQYFENLDWMRLNSLVKLLINFKSGFCLESNFISNTSSLEYDYMNSIEHINSFFNLYNIINYNFSGKLKDDFLPFKINLPDLNLFYNVHLTK